MPLVPWQGDPRSRSLRHCGRCALVGAIAGAIFGVPFHLLTGESWWAYPLWLGCGAAIGVFSQWAWYPWPS